MRGKYIVLFQSNRYFVSACAPIGVQQNEVEAYVLDVTGNDFIAVDKSQFDGTGKPTPNICDDYPKHRMHWFLMDRDLWASTKKQFQ